MFEPLKAIDALNLHAVDYVVVGGWGTLHHGATRLTQDLDICPELAPENLERLADALTALHAELQIAADQTLPVPIIDGRLLAQMQIGNWSTPTSRSRFRAGSPPRRSRTISCSSTSCCAAPSSGV